jgi:Ca2+-binding RTX toxin-like protein
MKPLQSGIFRQGRPWEGRRGEIFYLGSMSKTVGWGIPGAPRVALSVFVALCAALCLAPAASATHLPAVPDATAAGVSLDSANKRIIYKARPAEHNSITVTETVTDYVFTEVGTTEVSDPFTEVGNPLPPVVDNETGDVCTVTDGVTRCAKAGIDSIAVLLAGETGSRFACPLNPGGSSLCTDDVTADASPPKGTILDGGGGKDDLIGSPGDDDILGRDGVDFINARSGNDFVTLGTGGPLELHPSGEFYRGDQQDAAGGSGFDELRHDDRIGPVKMDFANPPGSVRDSDVGRCPVDAVSNPSGGCLDSVSNFEKLVGTSSALGDEIIGGDSAETLVGGGGPDTLCGGMGVDTVDYSGSSEGVTVTLDGVLPTDSRHTISPQGPGRDEYNKARKDCRETDPSLPNGPPLPGGRRDCTPNDGALNEHDCVGEDVENIVGSNSNDTLTGNSPDEFEGLGPKVEPHGINDIEGRGGDDLIDGRTGPDALSGGGGVDTVTYGSRPQPVSAAIDGAPNDGTKIAGATIAALQNGDFDYRTSLSDSIEDDVENIVGGMNDDTLRGDGDANKLQGGTGADFIDGAGGNDQLEGDTDNDILAGGDGGDALLGGVGADALDGEAGNDNVQGGAGGDIVSGGPGADTLSGGDDGSEDTVDYSDATTPLHVSADNVNDDGRAGEGDNVVADFEIILGGSDADVLAGGSGSQFISGGDGDDLLSGGGGADDFSGGTGSDAVTYAAAGGSVFVNLAEAGNDGEPGEADYVLEDVEKVVGGSGDDTLLGDAKANVLEGGAGNDRLAGAEGDDLLGGELGNDTLSGDVGNDALFGSDGNDNLSGGDGNDDLKGEAGDDNLDGGSGSDRHSGGPHLDAISYSTRTAGVTVNLDGTDKNGQGNENDFIGNDVENVTTGSGGDTIDSDDNKRSRVKCGGGSDVVTADPDDVVDADCENKRVFALGTRCSASSGRVSMAKSGAIRVRVFCAVQAKGTLRLQSVMRVRAGKSKARKVLKLGSKSFSLKAGQRRTISVKASKAGRRFIQRKKRLSVRAKITAKAQGKSASLKSSSVLTVRARG